MTIEPILIIIATLVVLLIYLDGAIKRNKQNQAALDELHRWRSGWEESRRWLAEFRDVSLYPSPRPRPRRDQPDGGTSINYQHLSAECDGCDDAPAAPEFVQHHPV